MLASLTPVLAALSEPSQSSRDLGIVDRHELTVVRTMVLPLLVAEELDRSREVRPHLPQQRELALR